MPFSDSFFKNKFVLSAILFALALIFYFPILGQGFLHFDDQKYVTENPYVLAGVSWSSLKWAFFSLGVDNWIPLTWLSHMLDVHFFGLHASGHHAMNLLLHAANSILLFITFDRLTSRRILSWLIALIFALHPMHVESVAWISERKDILSTFLILAALYAYSMSRIRFSVCFFVCSLLAKPMYVTFPILLVILDFWPLQRILSIKDLMKSLLKKWPFFIFSVVIALVTIWVQQNAGTVLTSEELPWIYRIAFSCMSVACYFQKFFFPVGLSIFHPAFSVHDFQFWGLWATLTLSCITVTIIYLFRKKCEWILAGWFIFLVALLPTLGLIKAGSQSIADRYTYFAYVGLTIVLLWLGAACVRVKPFLRTPLIVILFLWIGLCGVKTVNRIQDWQSTEKLFLSATRIHPHNYVAYKVLADDAYHRGDLVGAAKYLEQTLNVLPAEAESNRVGYELNLAIVYHQSERFDLAAQTYEKVIERLPLRPDLIIALGDVYMKLNQPAQARLQYEKSLHFFPGNRDLQEKLNRTKTAKL